MTAGKRRGDPDRVAGILIGIAAGDRNGGPVRMAVRLAESLLESSGLDLADVGSRYLQWWREGAFDTGPVCADVLSRRAAGTSFAEAAREVDREVAGKTAGCNPAHRAPPIAMAAFLCDADLADLARRGRRPAAHGLATDWFGD